MGLRSLARPYTCREMDVLVLGTPGVVGVTVTMTFTGQTRSYVS